MRHSAINICMELAHLLWTGVAGRNFGTLDKAATGLLCQFGNGKAKKNHDSNFIILKPGRVPKNNRVPGHPTPLQPLDDHGYR